MASSSALAVRTAWARLALAIRVARCRPPRAVSPGVSAGRRTSITPSPRARAWMTSASRAQRAGTNDAQIGFEDFRHDRQRHEVLLAGLMG
ncbi:MAG: hypothetical protein MO852_02520 [Candidatus Devosia euplotis]|nr:hypothetical protein [Candidatus Devosia euplotis]